MPTLVDFLTVSAILFGIGLAGIMINRKNIIVVLMSVELLLLAVNTNFIAFSYFMENTIGQIFVFFILTVASAEAAIGLAIMVVLFRRRGTIEVQALDLLRG
jgi:NADH-quinone oxidoreductase subunit K